MEYANNNKTEVTAPTGVTMRVNYPFIIKESDINKYAGFGKGYRTLECIGFLSEDGE